MNAPLFGRTWRAQATKVWVVMAGLAAWGLLMPVIYASYGSQFKQLFDSGLIPRQFADFGGGDIFSLGGAIALGFIHPIAVALNAVFAIGFAAAAVAGERQRGTLEVLLARPLSRRSVTLTLYAAIVLFAALAIAAIVAGAVVGSALSGVAGELAPDRLAALWLNGFLLYAAMGAIALAASVSFDRLTPALGIALVFLIVSYFLEVIGSLWPDAKGLQPLSVFHYVQAREVLAGHVDPANFAVLLGVAVIGLAAALLIFPRRDLAAPS